jgi:hypothetical protein
MRMTYPDSQSADPSAPPPRPVLPLDYSTPAASLPYMHPALAALLNLLTFSLFPLGWFNRMHDYLPRIRRDDPSGASGFLLCFVPVYNIYWFFFTVLRFIERLDEQRAAMGLAPSGIRPVAILMCVAVVCPPFTPIGMFAIGTIYTYQVQQCVNEMRGVVAQHHFTSSVP